MAGDVNPNSNPHPNPFGSWLRGRRREAGFNQEELAERIGCSLITLQKIESGERRPSRQMALLLASQLNIPPDEHEAFVIFARTNSSHSISDNTNVPHSPWRTAHRRHTNIPVALTVLLGRERDEAAVRDLLLQTRTRLVTLVGPPGVGKTRLASQVASGLSDSFEDGVFFVDLSPILDPNLVLPTIARVLGLRESPAQSIGELLESHLSDKRVLILLDNFEQVLDAAPAFASLLQACPWLKVLVTSREALHVRGERRFNVPPLALPDSRAYSDDSPGYDAINLDELASNPSVELFIERAQDADQSFDLQEKNARDIAAVCAGLDGLPLAIELAAARADTISPADMRSGLNSRLQLLNKGARDFPPRQRTLRNAVEWSYSLLVPADRRTLEHTSVFAGGFTLEAAIAVCSPTLGEPASTHDHLSSLVSKSLLQRYDAGAEGTEPRYRYLETLREYAAERLDEGNPDAVRLQHAEYFVHLVESISPRLTSNEQAALMSQLLREHDNIRAALSWAVHPTHESPATAIQQSAIHNQKTELALRLSAALWRFWLVQGFVSEGCGRLDAAVRSAGIEPHEPLESEIEQHPLIGTLRQAFYGMGVLGHTMGNFQGALDMFNRSMEIAHLMGNKAFEASALAGLSNVYGNLEDYAALRRMRERELVLRRAIGEPYTLASCLLGLCEAATFERDFPRALELQEEALAIFRSLDSREGIGRSLSNLGDIQLAIEDYNSAWHTNQELLGIARDLDQKEGIAFALRGLGYAAAGLQRHQEAIDNFRESLAMFKKLESRLHIITCLEGIATVYSATDRQEDAAVLFGASRSLRQGLAIPEQPLPLTLGTVQLQQAFASGTSLTFDEAIALALAPTAEKRSG